MKKFATATIVMMASVLSGCLGQNALFNSLQDWNAKATNEKFANQAISFAFWWIPVYSLSLLADIVVINSIEFWTGTNPLSKTGAKVAGTTERVDDGLGNFAELTYNGDGSITVVSVADDVTETYTLVRKGDQVIKQQGDKQQVIGSVML